MPTHVNLDALIPREDFEVIDIVSSSGRHTDTLTINNLKNDDFFFSAIRKPDFQRETSEWDPDKICDFITSFIEGDLIPAIILWRSKGSYIFVIDGSHRISALASWVNDDYGDGTISKLFYDGVIPEDQIEIAEATRTIVRKKVGPFSDYQLALNHPDKVTAEIVSRAKNLGAIAIQLQWVTGDAKTAEQSFFKINQQAAPINPTEFRLIKARRKPNGLAARAIINSGKGHKYWSQFPDQAQEEVQQFASEIHSLLFKPRFQSPVKTLELPIAGKISSSQSFSLVMDFVNIVNNCPANEEDLLEDTSGTETLSYLRECLRVAQRVNSKEPFSLGLHPIVYFYANNGRHKTASFFAFVAFMLELESNGKINQFIKNRSKFEEFLLKYDYLVQQIVRKYRSAIKAYSHMKEFFKLLLEFLDQDKIETQITESILKNTRFDYLTLTARRPSVGKNIRDFSRETKSEAYISKAISSALRCEICNGYLHSHSISIDHKERKEDGGKGNVENAQLTHPYCNTGYKEYLVAKQKQQPTRS
jgi:hypothetical protein